MEAWAGMERFLHLSLGSQVGASGVALIAVLELKRMLQNQAGYQKEARISIIKLTSEEWRTVAGIHERKTFERAKAKLEELKVLKIERKGKLLEITLWPEAEIRSETEPWTVPGTSFGTDNETSSGTSNETSTGISRETVAVSKHEFASSPKENEVLQEAEVSMNLDSLRDQRKPLKRNSLFRNSLNRHYINNNNAINEINDTTNNDQLINELESASPFSKEKRSEFETHWVEEVGHPLTPYEQEGLALFRRLGYSEDLFMEALRCAVAADNRRMGYVLGILRNWHQEGVRCVNDLASIKKRWEDQRFLKRPKTG